MKIKQILAVALVSLGSMFGTSAALAGPMSGLTGFGDGLEGTLATPTAVVAGINFFDAFNGAGQSTMGPCLGDFSAISPCPQAGTAVNDFVFGAQNTLAFTGGGFDFYVTLVGINQVDTPLSCNALTHLCSDGTTFVATGYVHDQSGTFVDTLALFQFALSGDCLDTDGDNKCNGSYGGNYGVTIIATGQPRLVPEPGTLALLGLTFLGAAVARRRRS